jgi:lactoylglutathione lyase
MKVAMKYIILYVTDFETSMNFYTNILGLPIKMEAGTYVEFDTGSTTLAINTRESVTELTGLPVPGSSVNSQTFEVGFVVDDVAAAIGELRAQGVPIIVDPVTKPWGQTVAYIADPDGHFVEICDSV